MSFFDSLFQKSQAEQVIDRAGTLEEFLDAEDSLQEVKGQNAAVLDYIQIPEIQRSLLDIAAGAAPAGADIKRTQKLPFFATEILCCDLPTIAQAIVSNDERLDALFGFLTAPVPVDAGRASFAAKIIGSLLSRQATEMWAYMEKRPIIVQQMADHIGVLPVRELLGRLYGLDQADTRAIDFLNRAGLITLLIDRLSDSHTAETRANSAVALTEVVQKEFTQNSVLARELLSPDAINQVLNHSLNGATFGFAVLTAAIKRAARYSDFPSPAATVVARAAELSKLLAVTSGERVGSVRVAALELIASLVVSEQSAEVQQSLAESKVFIAALQLFFQYPWNNIVHIVVGAAVSDIVRSGGGALFNSLLEEGQLAARLVGALQANEEYSQGRPGRRLGYMGVVITILTQLESAAVEKPDGAVSAALKATDKWDWAATQAAAVRALNDRALGGAKPAASLFESDLRDDEFSSLPRKAATPTGGVAAVMPSAVSSSANKMFDASFDHDIATSKPATMAFDADFDADFDSVPNAPAATATATSASAAFDVDFGDDDDDDASAFRPATTAATQSTFEASFEPDFDAVVAQPPTPPSSQPEPQVVAQAPSVAAFAADFGDDDFNPRG
eukprot:TRINITY_DN5450_c0_g1_i1.p1 TRINITY_DN5450_c0_g1~~TRINITY_DN5450_c0_g1_i1.p1  ORF type:complete len:619 (-),score=177.32 TRINITY_DN5450_c0_g1_i1:17-1873(-)